MSGNGSAAKKQKKSCNKITNVCEERWEHYWEEFVQLQGDFKKNKNKFQEKMLAWKLFRPQKLLIASFKNHQKSAS